MTPELFIDCRCELGEGPLWHPDLNRLFWFDIINRRLMSATPSGQIVSDTRFEQTVSAAGIIDENTLAIAASETFLRYDISSGVSASLAPLEANPGNRSNDGRVNPAGGFWIGTMSRKGSSNPGVGSLYQYRAGRLETILTDLSIPNAACFSPDGRTAYFTGEASAFRVIKKVPLDPATGLPAGPWEPFVTVDAPIEPDGAVVDAEGYVWNAQWNGSRVVRYAPDGGIDRIVELPVSRVTCPAFGGDDLRTLYITTARAGLSAEELERQPHAGSVFALRVDVPGQAETRLKF